MWTEPGTQRWTTEPIGGAIRLPANRPPIVHSYPQVYPQMWVNLYPGGGSSNGFRTVPLDGENSGVSRATAGRRVVSATPFGP